MLVSTARLVREALASHIATAPGVDVVGFTDVPGSATAVALTRPDVVLIHVEQETPDVRPLLDDPNGARVIGIGSEPAEQALVRCVEAGMTGYVTLATSLEQFVADVEAVAAGAAEYGSIATAALMRRVVNLVNDRREAADEELTSRQREILHLVGEGRADKQIAAALGVSVSTIKNHLQRIYRKLGATSRTEAAAKARRPGPVDRS